MARAAAACVWAGLTLVLVASCAGATAGSPSLPLPSPLPAVSPTFPIASLPASPALLLEPAATFPVPTEYASLFDLAAAVYGWGRLIQRIRIPLLNLDSLVVPVGWRVDAQGTVEWDSPGPYVGWAVTSALPNGTGNVVLYGHNNIEGGVFRSLYRLQAADAITLVTAQGEWPYRVLEVRILAVGEKDVERQAYLAYLGRSDSQRLTIVSCYPPESNTHRVLVVAVPAAIK